MEPERRLREAIKQVEIAREDLDPPPHQDLPLPVNVRREVMLSTLSRAEYALRGVADELRDQREQGHDPGDTP